MVDQSSSVWLDREEAGTPERPAVMLAGKRIRATRVMSGVLGISMLLTVGAECAGVLLSPALGVLLHAVLFLGLVNSYLFAWALPRRRSLLVLSLVPLLRILSLTMPLARIHRIYWFVLAGIPLLIAALMVARAAGLSLGLGTSLPGRPTRPALARREWLVQGLIALNGLPLSVIAYYVLRPRPLIYRADFTWERVLLASITLVVFSGFLEEIIFRGLLQQVSTEVFGPVAGLLMSTLVFASSYIGSLSPSYVALMTLLGLVFGVCVYSTRSLRGVALAHGLLNVGALLLWPILLR